MNTPTLSQLADIGAKAAMELNNGPIGDCCAFGLDHCDYQEDRKYREAFAKAVLDAVGYKFPVDPEREAFDAWVAEQGDGFMPCDSADKAFGVWKAGREELRKQSGLTVGINKDAPVKPETNPPWIEWKGGKCPIPDTVESWEYRLNNGLKRFALSKPTSYAANWGHDEGFAPITAYRVLDWGTAKQPATFEAHGHTWFKHTPGDPCPVDGDVEVHVLWPSDNDMSVNTCGKAKDWRWDTSNRKDEQIIGWRHA